MSTSENDWPLIEGRRSGPTLGMVRLFGLQDVSQDAEGIPVMLHEHATAAFHVTMDALSAFATRTWIAGNGYVLPGIALWCLTAEASASLALAIAERHAEDRGHEFQRPARPNLVQKLGAVRSVLGAGPGVTASGSLFGRFKEFGWFRNQLVHDLTFEEAADPRTYRHTHFAHLVDLANEVDLLQACVLATSACQYVRHVAPGCDLMPDVFVEHHDAFVWEKLERLVAGVILPVFEELLHAKGLRTDVDLDLSDLTVGGESDRRVEIKVRARPSSADHEVPPVTSWSPRDRLAAFVAHLVPASDTFRLPSYHRRDACQADPEIT